MPLFSLFIFILFIDYLFTILLFTIIYLVFIYLAFTYLAFYYLQSYYLSLLNNVTLMYPDLFCLSTLLPAELPVTTSHTLAINTSLEVVERISTTSLRISSICLTAFCLDILIYIVAPFLGNVPLAVDLNKTFLHQVKFNITLKCSTTQTSFRTQLLQRCLTVTPQYC